MKNLSIRSKLLVVFIPLAAAVAAFGWYAYSQMNEMNDDMQTQVNNTTPAIMDAEEMNVHLGDYRIRQARHILSDSDEDMKQAEEDMAESLKELREHMDNYVKLMGADATDEERALVANIKNQLQVYLDAGVEMQKFSRARMDSESKAAFIGVSRTQYNKLGEMIDQLVDFNVKFSKQQAQESQQAFEATERVIFGGILAVIAALVVGLVALVRSIASPIKKMTGAMNTLAEGDLNVAIPAQGQRDEIGHMSKAVQVFKENAQKVADMTKQQAEADKRLAAEKKQAMQAMANNFESQVKSVVDMVASAATEMDATAKNVSHIATDSQQKLSTLTTDVNQASTNVDTVAAAASQLSQAIAEINRQVTRATTITSSAVDEAQKADGTVQELVNAASKIGAVVSMINTIAEQINLLALNATIEAARAGDAGKGFAVVASEVKTLATQTTKATSEITEYVSSIQDKTNHTVNVLKAITETIREISGISTTIAAAVEEQGVATQDIARNVQQAASSTKEVSAGAGTVTRSAEETGVAAQEMTAATSELSKQAEMLRGAVDQFLTGVRASA